jgi:integrase
MPFINISSIINGMSIKQRTVDNRFEGRITVNGIRKSFYGGTKAEVRRKAKEYLQKVENGYRDPQKIVLNDYIEYWLTTYKLNKIEPSSYTRLYSVFNCQIKNTLGTRMIGNITTADIQKFIDEHANPPDDAIKPLALSGLKRILHLLRPCMEMAVTEGIIYKNPCDNVQLPVESCIQTNTKVQTTLNDVEIAEFKEAALAKWNNNEYRSRDAIVLLIILNLGLRVGEAIALEWDDVNLEENIVYINKTVQSNIRNFSDVGNAQYVKVKSSTKTQAGVRVLPLNDTIVDYFNILKEYDLRNGIRSQYVCTTKTGKMKNARNLQRSLDRVMQNTHINKKVTLHTLRHTFGSTMLRRGVNIEVVSKLMGHANITITYTKYIHVIQEQKAKAMKTIAIC